MTTSAPAPAPSAAATRRQVDAARRTRGTLARRRFVDRLMLATFVGAGVLAVAPLVAILADLVRRAVPALTRPAFYLAVPRPVGEPGGGVANAILGSIVLLAVATALAVPVGVGAGLFLAERRRGRSASVVRFAADILSGLPSIVVGVVVWRLVVRPSGHFSATAGGIALAVLMIPLLARATEAVVRLVPAALMDAALALGYPRWRATLTVVVPTALPGIVSGALLALARAAGESAALLVTAFGNPFLSASLDAPIASLPLQIFTYTNSPYATWHEQAWGSAVVLLAIVGAVSFAARLGLRASLGAAMRGSAGA